MATVEQDVILHFAPRSDTHILLTPRARNADPSRILPEGGLTHA